MNAVLYTQDMEPITVIDLPMWSWDRLRAGGHVVVAAPLPVTLVTPTSENPPFFRTVTITAERLCRRGHETLMLFTSDEESALLLKADFLPGQRASVQRLKRDSFAAGVVAALMGDL